MYDTTNAHAATCTGSGPYNNQVCCSAGGCNPTCGVVTLPTTCSSLGADYEQVIALYADTNAHVQDPDSFNTYSTIVCCDTSACGGTLTCGVKATSCGADEETLASMKYQDNSHVGDETTYTEYKICCKIV